MGSMTLKGNISSYSVSVCDLAAGFFMLLQLSLDARSALMVWSVAGGFALAMYVNGWHWGRKSSGHVDASVLGLSYHFVAYLIVNSAQFIWAYQFSRENAFWVDDVALWWLLGLVTHAVGVYFSRKKSA